MAFGVKVKLDVEVVGGSKLRSQIQQAIENATQGKAVKIRHLSIDLGRQEAQRISKQLESALASQDITIKISKIDASKPVADLKKQLTTMLSGLSITGLRDFLGTEGVATSYDKAANAANKLAEAQENVRRKAEEANVALKTLKSVQSTLGNVFKDSTNIGDQDKLNDYIRRYQELLAASESAKNMQGDAQAAEVTRITAATVALKREVTAQLEVEKAAKRAANAQAAASNKTKDDAAAKERAAKKEADLARQTIQLRQRINTWVDNNSKAYKQNKTEIDSLLAILKNESSVSASSLADVRRRFEEINASARVAGVTGKTFFDTLKAGWAKFGGWSLVTKSMMMAVNGVKKMVRAVIELDAAMTELKKVTNLTDQAYASFANKAAQTAKKVGASVADTINATADFARLGYSVKEASSLAEAALVYKNVGDGIDDISIATESLISTLKAFGIEADNAMGVVDMFNEVGNNFAISSLGIGEALRRSASALASAGNTIEQSIGLVTAMNSVVQDPDSVGTALKTLTMYLRAAKTEAEEAGLETEGMANSVSELRNELKSLTGIDIMINDDTFKSTYQIIQEIAAIWDNLTDISRSNVLNLLGGKRNANVVASLITNFKDAEAAMKSAMNSLGSATAENEKYLDSINGKIATLKAVFEELSSNVVRSGLVKFLLDVANVVTSIVNGMAKLHMLVPAITTVVTSLKAISDRRKVSNVVSSLSGIFGEATRLGNQGEATQAGNLAYGAVGQALDGLTKSQKKLALQQIEVAINSSNMSQALKNQAREALNAATATQTLSRGAKAAGLNFKSFLGIFKSWQFWLVIIEVAIGMIIRLVEKQKQAFQESIDKANELTEAYTEANKEHDSNVKTLKSLEDEFNRLSDGVDSNGNRVSLTASQYERYKDIVDQIIGISPSVCAGYDNEGKAIVNYSNLISEAIEKQDEYLDKQREIQLGNRDTVFKGAQNELKNVREEARSAVEQIGWAFYDLRKDIYGKWSSASDLDLFLKEFGDLYGIKGLEALNTQSGSMSDAMYEAAMKLYEHRSEFMAYLSTKIDEDGDTYDKINQRILALAAMPQKLSESTAGWREYIDTWIRYATDGSGNPINDWFSEIPVSAMTAFNDHLDSLCVGFALLNISAKQAQEQVAQYGQEFVNTLASDGAQDILNMAVSMANGTVTVADYNAAVAAYLKTLEEGSPIVFLMSDYLYGLTDSVTSDAEAVEQATKAYTGLTDALKRLSDGYSILETAEKEMADGSLSLDTVKKIADSLDENELLTDYVYEENGALKLNTDAWVRRSEAIAAADKEYLEKQKAELEHLKEQNELVKQYEGQSYEQILDSKGKDTADSVKAAREYVSGHVAELATLDEQLAHTTGMIEIYGIALKEAGSGDDPLNLSSMISDLDSVGGKAKELLSALDELKDGTAMSAGEIASLALQYEELFGVAPEYDLTTLDGQKAAIEAVIAAYEQEFDAIIDTQIAELEAAKSREDITENEAKAIKAKISRLEWLKKLTLSDIFGGKEAEDASEKYKKLADMIGDATDAANMLAAMKKGNDYLGTFQKIVNFLKDNKEFSFGDFFNTDGSFKEVTPELIDKVINSMLKGMEEIEGWQPEFGQMIREQCKQIIDGTDEVKSGLEGIADGMNAIKGAADMLAGMKSGDDYLGTMQEILEFVQKHKGFSLDDFLNADGTFKDVDEALAKRVFDGLLEEMKNLDGYRPEFGEAMRKQFNLIIQSSGEAKSVLEQFSDGLGAIESAANMLSGMKAGDDYIGTMQDIIDFMQDNEGFSFDDFINPDGSLKDVDDALINRIFDSMLAKLESLDGWKPEFGTALRQQFDLIVAGEAEAESAIDKLKTALNTIGNVNDFFALVADSDSSVIDQLNAALELAEAFADAQGNAVDWTQWINDISADGSKITWNADAIRAMSDAQVDAAFSTTELAKAHPELIQQIKDAANAAAQAEVAADRVASAYSKMQAALNSHSEYGGYTQITHEDYQSLIDADARYADAIEYQNGVMVLNGAKHDEITAKILEETRTMALAEKQMILMSDEYQDLSQRFASGLLTEGTDLQRLLDLEAQIKGFDILANEIDSATSAYYRWLNRKGDDGMDRYSQAQQALELINGTLNDPKSEYYGRIGREDFGLAVDFVLGEHVELNTPEFEKAMNLAKRYLTEGAEGAANFYDDLVSAGLLDATTGTLDSTIAEMSQKLGISEEMVRTMIDRLNEYQDEAAKIKVTEPEVDTGESETALEQVIKSLEDANKYIEEISNTPLAIEIQNAEETTTGLTTLGEAFDKIKSGIAAIFQNPQSFNLADLSTAVQSITGYLTDISAAIETVNGLKLDVDGGASIDALNALDAAAQTVTTSLSAIAGILDAIVTSRNDVNSQEIDITTGRSSSLLGSVSSTLSSIINKLNQIKKNSNITIRINEVTTKTTKSSGGGFWSRLFGSASVSGNAAARGTAMAAGGHTLVGELGMETVVDPATNRWYTVGERGAEFVRLPKDAIVFNHKQTEELFGVGRIDSRGDALASGNAALSMKSVASKIGGTLVKAASNLTKKKDSIKSTTKKGSSNNTILTGIANGIIKGASNLVSGAIEGAKNLFKKTLSDQAKGNGGLKSPTSGSSSGNKTGGSGGSSGGSSSGKSALEKLKEQYEELNKQTEHLIAHQEFLYKQAEKGLDYSGMDRSLQAQAELYKKLMADSQAAVADMIAHGADDTDEELQAMEEAYWSAYDSLYETLDKINALYVDALNDKIDGIQTAFDNLKTAAEEFNNYGGITIDSFQALLENGVQYMSLLENQNGQYVINTEGIQKMIAAQKEQLAVESAISYLKQLQTALADGEANAVANLVNLTNQLSSSTWDAVYAQAALLRENLTEDQYARVIANIDALRDISLSVITDISKNLDSTDTSRKEGAKNQQDALEKILDLTEDLIKAEAEDRIDAIEDEIDAYQKIIDLKKESLRSSKEENDYAKSVAEKTSEIAKMQARIDQLKLDDSRAARAERAKLEQELAELQNDLGDLQSEHSYDQQESALDKAAQDFEDARQQEIDAIENSISSTEKLYRAAIERLSNGWDSLYDELIAWNTEAGSSLNSEITEKWLAAAEAVKLYGSYLEAVAALEQKQSGTGSNSSSNVVAKGELTKIPAAPSAPPPSEATNPTVPETETAAEPEPVRKVKVVDGRWNVRTGPSTSKKILGVVGEGTVLDYRGQTSGSWYAVTYKGQDAWINNGGSKLIEEIPKYHGGGIAGDKATQKDNEVLSVLEEGEMILTDKMKKAAYTLIDFKDYLEKKLGNAIGLVSAPIPQLPALAGVGHLGSGASIGQISFNPTIQVEINHSGAMTDKDAKQYGKTIANTAMDELYEGFRQRGIGKIFGTKPTK